MRDLPWFVTNTWSCLSASIFCGHQRKCALFEDGNSDLCFGRKAVHHCSVCTQLWFLSQLPSFAMKFAVQHIGGCLLNHRAICVCHSFLVIQEVSGRSWLSNWVIWLIGIKKFTCYGFLRAAWWWEQSPYSKKVLGSIAGLAKGTFLCWVCMFSPCMCGLPPGCAPVQRHAD